MRTIPASELIINSDGSIFHLHLKPEELADIVILVGDPGRVEMVSGYFDKVELTKANREFVSNTGIYKGERLTVLSTGIGTDNIDIVVTELDALVNVNFNTRTEKEEKKELRILRLGTSGAVQADIPVGSFVMSDISIGFDGLLNFYEGRDKVCLLSYEKAFVEHMSWLPQLPAPYFVESSELLVQLFGDSVLHGMTISSPGFYGPQGRVVRIPLADPKQNEKIESFSYNGKRITNFEMESSALAGLSALLGHEASTICTVIANRDNKTANSDYQPFVRQMVEMALDKLVEL
ncbi:MAG: nucleoside phosphorylase [Prevotellaceae bacterium]|jgi:uridine phosphorylase|nr:nucleoside phosphorylase [Prevotellaceae bacterium]